MTIPDELFDKFSMDEIKVYLFIRYWNEKFGAGNALPPKDYIEKYLNMSFEDYYSIVCDLVERKALSVKPNRCNFLSPYPWLNPTILSQSFMKG